MHMVLDSGDIAQWKVPETSQMGTDLVVDGRSQEKAQIAHTTAWNG